MDPLVSILFAIFVKYFMDRAAGSGDGNDDNRESGKNERERERESGQREQKYVRDAVV